MQSKPILTIPVTASEAVAAETFGTLTGATVAPGASAAGVFTTDGQPGDVLPLECIGTSVVVAGAAVSKGDEIQVGTAGRAITKTTGVTVARATEDAAGDGARFEVLLTANS